MGLSLITAATHEPVALNDALDYCRIDHSDEDAQVRRWIAAAREQAEKFTGRQLVDATYDETFDAFCTPLRLQKPPLDSITSLKYVDTAGTTQTWGSGNYTVLTDRAKGEVVPAYNVSWPSIRDVPNAVTVRFVAGYGTAADVPDAIKMAIQLLVSDMNEHREAQMDMVLNENEAVMRLLWPYRVIEA